MKKLAFIFSIITLCLIGPSLSEAATPVQYNHKVNVSIHKAATVSMNLTGNYQLINKQTNETVALPANTSLTATKDSSGITVVYAGTTKKSATGFDLLELSGSTQLASVSNNLKYRGSFTLKPNGSHVEIINSLDMEDYLRGVVPSEMPASWPKEALKAQAISARSYAANTMNLSSTATSQVYRGYTGEDSRSNTAIDETRGLVVKYNGKPIQTFFFSTSGGQTANVGDVWNSNQSSFPYLVSVSDPYENSPYSNWTETFSAAQIVQAFGFPSTAKLLDFTLTERGVNGEIGSVSIKTSAGNKTISGNESVIRKLFALNDSSVYNQLYSNWFTAQINGAVQNFTVQTSTGSSTIQDMNGQKVMTASGEVTLSDSQVSIQTANGVVTNEGESITSVTLNGKGWGHRIGMSQYGAKGFAEQGWKAADIITHYFQGTTVAPL